jgi:hypothetical protein
MCLLYCWQKTRVALDHKLQSVFFGSNVVTFAHLSECCKLCVSVIVHLLSYRLHMMHMSNHSCLGI